MTSITGSLTFSLHAGISRSEIIPFLKNDPIHDAANDAQLRRAIRDQMTPCHVVLIMAGVYATYSKWINIEIDLATKGFQHPKPIIAIRPRGNEVISRPVRNAADKIVNWNTE